MAAAILVRSGDSEGLDELAGQPEAWGCAVVTKPFDIDVFLATVASALRRGRWPRSARLCGAVEAPLADDGIPLSPSDQERYQAAVAALRGQLGEEASAAGWLA